MVTEYVITLDGGTTNTRAFLWRGNTQIGHAMRAVGVKETAICGNNEALLRAVGECLLELLARAKLSWGELRCILGAGMLTSDLGLWEVPHLQAPAGLSAFAAELYRVELPALCPLPIWLLPGLRNTVAPLTPHNLGEIDCMRGEEAEALALWPQLAWKKDGVLILPGSHTKLVGVDREGRLTGCATTLTGELLALLTRESILAGDVQASFVDRDALDFDFLRTGYLAAREAGPGKAVFATRLLRLFGDSTTAQRASYLLGAVLEGDVRALWGSRILRVTEQTPVAVIGKEPFCAALVELLRAEGGLADVSGLLPGAESLSGLGCLYVARARGLLAEPEVSG